MTDFANLQIRVGSGEVTKADQSLKGLAESGAKAERATDGLTTAFKSFIGPLTAVLSVGKLATDLVEVQRRYDKISTALTTVTGSSKAAAETFKVLQEYAYNTPFSIENLNEAFVKLVNYGLNPGEEALTSYGNTASSMGKDITEMVDAVAAATTGNFQSLGNFGIRAKNMGDKVAFSFQGTTTVVRNSSKDIENYLLGLGKVQFAGAMENSLGKLDDTILALGEQYDNMLLALSQSGIGDIIKDGVQVAVNALSDLTDFIASGEMEGYVKAFGSLWRGWGQDVTDTIRITKDEFKDWGDEGTSVIKFFIDAFVQFPVNVRALVQTFAVELFAFLETLKAQAVEFKDDIKAIFTSSTIADASKKYEDRIKVINEAREESLADIVAERDAAISSYDDQIDKAKDLRKEFDKNKEAGKPQGDRLARFQVKGSGDTSGPSAEELAKQKASKKEYQDLLDSLRTEEEAIQESYNRRVAIIAKNTEYGSAKRLELMKRAGEERDAAFQGIQDSQDQERQSLYNSLLSEEESLRQSYEDRKKQILESTAVTEQERIDLMRRLNEQYATEQDQINQRRTQEQLAAAQVLFGGLTDLAKEYGGEQSQAYKVLFSISKAFSIAQAIMSIQTGIAKAQELGFPANLAEMARVAATGAGIVASIRGSNFSGAYDKGGYIPGGKVGLVGEYGPELVRGPAMVTGREDTKSMMGRAEPAKPPVVNIRNINVLDPSVVGDYLATDAGEQLVVNIMRRNQRVLSA